MPASEKPRSGRTLKTIGSTLFIVGGLLAYTVRPSIVDDTGAWLVVVFMIFGGAFLSWRGRQYAGRDIAEKVIADSKPDVLYLRDFRSDPSLIRHVFSLDFNWGELTPEEQLGEVLQPFGDLVAIGRPGEKLPTPGAARQYVSDEEWKEVVQNQMRAARLIVLRAGSGEGLLWEMKQAVEILNPQTLLILVLKMTNKQYESFREKTNPILGVSLPERSRRFGRVSGLISFSSD